MPRPKTQPDEQVLEAALKLMHEAGPDALTFAALAERSGLSAATLVQRFGNKARLKQLALLHAWDQLDATTAQLAASCPDTPAGAIQLLVALSADYGGIEAYADGLLVLREDLRDPALRARGAAWKEALSGALEQRFRQFPGIPPGTGLLLATYWQGALLWWSFDPQQPVTDYVEAALGEFVSRLVSSG